MANNLPTPAQLIAANLIAINNPQTNGKPDRSYDSVHKNFPPIEVIYVTPLPTPPPVNYTLTFNTEGGSSVPPITAVSGTAISLPSTTLSGATFNGWFLTSSGGTAQTSPFTLTSSLTFYAQWTAVTPPPPLPSGLALGINAGSIMWVKANDPSNASAFALLKELGAKYVRIAVPWNYSANGGSWTSFFNSNGSYNTEAASQINAIITIAASYGLTVLFLIDGCIAPSGTYTGNPQYEAGLPITPQAFAEACAWVASQCPGQHWELINEPDQYQYGTGAQVQMTPATLAEAVKLAYPAMKAADPTCVVHMGPVANISNGSGGYNFLKGCYEAGVAGFFDILSFHCYSWPGNGTYLTTKNGSPLDQQITGALIPLQAEYGDKSPLWLTETGWLSSGTGQTPDMTDALQSQYLVQWIERLQQLPVAVVFQYCLIDWTTTYGFWGLVDFNGNKKPSFSAVQALAL